MNKALPLALGLLVGAVGASAQTRFEEDFDDASKPWQEVSAQLPAPPKPENLLRVNAGPTATLSFALDAKSLTVGTDGVVRYTLVATSAGGAQNVSYEGIRCASYEKKLYAFGHKDGQWSRSRRDQWEPVTQTVANQQHSSLARDYFCDGQSVAGNANDILARFRSERPLKKESLYLSN